MLMLNALRRSFIWISFAFVGITVIAQTTVCPAIVENALNSIDAVCSEAGRNQACYGNVAIETRFHADVTDVTFADVGDIADVTAIQSMQLSPMDEVNGKWGVAMLRLQANIPDTLPGQNVTFLLFGDVEIADASADFPNADLTPMHAFYLKTGVGDANCSEAPESGVLVQTPDGVTDVVFNVNGIDVAMGSTILFQAEANAHMHVHSLEGSAMMEHEGEIHTAVAGTRLRVPIDENFNPMGAPALPESYDADLINRIPHQHLEREIAPPEPFTAEQLAQLHTMIGSGQLPCGIDGLPDCDKLPSGGLREGPMCQHDPSGCTERLAPHESKGIRQPDMPMNNNTRPNNPTPRGDQRDGTPPTTPDSNARPSDRDEPPPSDQNSGPPTRSEQPSTNTIDDGQPLDRGEQPATEGRGGKPPRGGN